MNIVHILNKYVSCYQLSLKRNPYRLRRFLNILFSLQLFSLCHFKITFRFVIGMHRTIHLIKHMINTHVNKPFFKKKHTHTHVNLYLETTFKLNPRLKSFSSKFCDFSLEVNRRESCVPAGGFGSSSHRRSG